MSLPEEYHPHLQRAKVKNIYNQLLASELPYIDKKPYFDLLEQILEKCHRLRCLYSEEQWNNMDIMAQVWGRSTIQKEYRQELKLLASTIRQSIHEVKEREKAWSEDSKRQSGEDHSG